MKDDTYQDEMKAIKHLQDRSLAIDKEHVEISSDLESLKKKIEHLTQGIDIDKSVIAQLKSVHMEAMTPDGVIESNELSVIFRDANSQYSEKIEIHEILVKEDVDVISKKLESQIEAFNRKYSLDSWDYAIAGSCGLFAALLDMFLVKAPSRPTITKFGQDVDGVFNQVVQEAFNKLIPPELSEKLSKANKISAPDSSVMEDLIDAPDKALSPMNHRLRALSHDPIIGFIVGVLDMRNGTCTVVNEGTIKVLKSTKAPTEGSVFELLGRMLGHLLSDVNAPSAKGNIGMGLPAPFMGILRMFECIPVGDSDFGKQIEWMYVNGYDFRHFVVTSIPMAIMEVMMRSCYVAKQMKLNEAGFGESMMDTMPLGMNPRFRMMLAIAYGVSSSVNAGKVYVTQNILNANYASWMGLAWNGFHAMKWALLDRSLALWGGIEQTEIDEIFKITEELEVMAVRASMLPV